MVPPRHPPVMLSSASFLRNPARSYGDPRGGSALIHGENLEALSRLRAAFEARFRCIYLDPPFNTGRKFAEYDRRPLA